MINSGLELCSRAITCLKRPVPAAHGVVDLPELECPVMTDLGNGLLAGYLVDQGSHFQYIQRRHLADARWTETALHESGLDNLAALLRKNGAKIQPYGAVHAVLFGGNFEASLILIDELWDKHLAHLAPNGFVAAIPNRDILAFCDANSEAGIVELRHIIARTEGGDHPLTTNLYRRGPAHRSWRPYAT